VNHLVLNVLVVSDRPKITDFTQPISASSSSFKPQFITHKFADKALEYLATPIAPHFNLTIVDLVDSEQGFKLIDAIAKMREVDNVLFFMEDITQGVVWKPQIIRYFNRDFKVADFQQTIQLVLKREQTLIEQTRQKELYQSLYNAGQSISSSLNPSEALAEIVREALHIFGANENQTNCFSHIGIGSLGRLKFITASKNIRSLLDPNLDEIDLSQKSGPIGIAGRAILSNQPRNVGNVPLDPDYIPTRSDVNSQLSVPFIIDDDNIGVLTIEHIDLMAFDDEDVEKVKLLARSAAIATRNAIVYEKTRNQVSTFQTLNETVTALNDTTSLSFSTALNEIARKALQVIGEEPDPQGCFAHITLVEDGKFKYVASSPPQLMEELQKAGADVDLYKGTARIGISGRAYLTGETQNVGDVSQNDYYYPIPSNPNIHSQLSVLLKNDKQVLGVLSIEHTAYNAFSADIEDTIKTLAQKVTTTLQLRQTTQKAAQKVAHTATKIVGLDQLEDCLHAILENAQLNLGFDLASIHVYDPTRQRFEQNEFERRICIGNLEFLGSPTPITAQSILHTVIQLEAPYYKIEKTEVPNTTIPRRFAQREKLKVGLLIQLRFNDVPVGVFFINYRDSFDFTEQYISEAQQFADQAASAISTYQLNEQLKRREKMFDKLLHANVAINSSPSLEAIYQSITSLAIDFIADEQKDNYFSHFALKSGNRLRWVSTNRPENLQDLQEKSVDIDPDNPNLQEENVDIDPDNPQRSPFSISARAVFLQKTVNVEDVTNDNDYITIEKNMRSQLSVPFMFGTDNREVIGVLGIEHPNKKAFTREDEIYLEIFAAHCTISIRNTKRRKALEAINLAAQAVASQDLVKVQTLEAITLQALQLIEADHLEGCFSHICIVTTTASKRKLDFISASSSKVLEKLQAIQTTIDLDDPNARHTLAGQAGLEEKIIKEGKLSESTPHFVPLPDNQIKSILCIPHRLDEDRVVVLSVNHPELNAFGPLEEENLQVLTIQAAIALHNCELLEQTQKGLHVLTELQKSTKAIAQGTELEKILKKIVEQAIKFVGKDEQGRAAIARGAFSHIALVEENYNTLRFWSASDSLGWDTIKAYGPRDLRKDGKDIGITGLAAKTRQLTYVPDVTKDLGSQYYIPFKYDIKSQLSIPILIERDQLDLLGVLSIEHPDLAPFSEEDINYVQILADHAALAIHNAQLYDAQCLLAVNNVQGSIWGHALAPRARTIIEIVKSYRAKNDNAAHLITIEEAAQEILDTPYGSILKNMDNEKESVTITKFVAEYVKRYRENKKKSPQELYYDPSEVQAAINVEINPYLVREALTLLINNAFEATKHLTNPQVTILIQQAGDYVEIIVQDNGEGLPDHVIPRVFILPISKKLGESGQGIGLMLVRAIIAQYKGKTRHHLFQDAEQNKFTQMIISLPISPTNVVDHL
jgi:GAF domain-containing protein